MNASKEFRKAFGEALDHAIERATGLGSLADLARQWGISPVTVSSWRSLKKSTQKPVPIAKIKEVAELAGYGEHATHRLLVLWLEDRLQGSRFGKLTLKVKKSYERYADPEEVVTLEKDLLRMYLDGLPSKEGGTKENGEVKNGSS